MENGLTKITFHGNLAEAIGQETWTLKIASVSEALRAVDIMSKRKLSKAIIENEKKNIKYKILANDKNLLSRQIDTVEKAKISELFITKNFKTIDVVPVLEGANDDLKDFAMMIGGAMLMSMGYSMDKPMLMMIGAYAILTGMSNLLSSPPEYEDYQEIQQITKSESYLFNGPVNTFNAGGPVPIGYGRLLVGSLCIAYSHEHTDRKIYENGEYL